MPHFQDKSWRISYSSDENNPIADFYIPALECAIQYDRKSGFFNSAILSRVARGLGAMLSSSGKIRLLMGCQFSPQDLQAIATGYALRERLALRLEQNLVPPENFAQLKHFEILSWLIENDRLDIKIAIPVLHNGLPSQEEILDVHHIFHEKVGIFTDGRGDHLVFVGSNNESLGGWEQNVESFHVYCSWEGGRDKERISEEQYRFDQLWFDVSNNVRIFEVPEAIKRKLISYGGGFKNKPIWQMSQEYDERKLEEGNRQEARGRRQEAGGRRQEATPTSDRSQKSEVRSQKLETSPSPPPSPSSPLLETLLNLHSHPGCLDYCLKSIPIKPWVHQEKILKRVAKQFPRNYLIADEVGLGKTIETGLILRYLLVSRSVSRVLILAPASVLTQWQEELKEKFNLHFLCYKNGELEDYYGEKKKALNPWETDLLLCSSQLIKRQDRQNEILRVNWDLIIVDEAHHARRRNPQKREDTPNRLLSLLRQLKEKTKSFLLLSATPMQLDPIELFDLLQLLGLKGAWNSGDNFCQYFDLLNCEANRRTLEVWQTLSVDYFNLGGQVCDRYLEYLTKTNRLLLYRLKDIWQKGDKIFNPQALINDHAFIEASKQFLTINTPLKDLMFRHTRETLREYYRRGIIKTPIPQREVFDNAIALNQEREASLYQDVSDYVRHFYQLAQKEHRQGLGFLMTLYRRRLTSSFRAVYLSLKRRLEGISVTEDDLIDLEDASDNIIEGLEKYYSPIDSEEIDYLERLVKQLENTGEDTKLSHFIRILRTELSMRETAIVFSQYTDTMDYLKDNLLQLYGEQIACYSGRGGELYKEGQWHLVKKEQIKKAFGEGKIKILLCTKSASEGLNLQTCGVLINYDMPWNPMQVEQQIGRLDRIGQLYPTVRIFNLFYDGTVEIKVYRRLRNRINSFNNIVGNLQPILAIVPTFIEQAAMAADPEEEDVLLSQFEQILSAGSNRPGIDEMVSIDVDSDLQEVREKIAPSPITPQEIEALFTTSNTLREAGYLFQDLGEKKWLVTDQGKVYQVTFYPDIYDEFPQGRLMSFGDKLFEKMLNCFNIVST